MDSKISLCISEDDKAALVEYAQEHDMTIS